MMRSFIGATSGKITFNFLLLLECKKWVYFLSVDYIDGTSDLITGDVTIIR